MNDYCFKCNSHVCTCGEMYKEMSEEKLYKIILACGKALGEKTNQAIEIKINDKYVTTKLAEIDMRPLFSDKGQLDLLKNSDKLPKAWCNLFEKSKTLQDVKNALMNKDEDSFPLIGLLLFMLFDCLNARSGKSSLDMFIGAVKAFYPRETPLRDIIESCGSNYKALESNLNLILKEAKEKGYQWDDNFNAYSVISTYIRYSLTNVNGSNVALMYKLLQCIALGSAVDLLYTDMCKLSDELFYVDETLYNYMKQYEFPVDSASIRL
ncbi:MAG: hypothetical protein IKA36_04085 [Clostridia bacterium]|nr:hypothetical protein [Clostridia bacterium]